MTPESEDNSSEFILQIYYSPQNNSSPVTIVVRKVNIDPKGFLISECEGRTLDSAMKKAMDAILRNQWDRLSLSPLPNKHRHSNLK